MVSDSVCSAALEILALATLSSSIKTFIKLHGYLLNITQRMKSVIFPSAVDGVHYYKMLEFIEVLIVAVITFCSEPKSD